MPMKALSFKGDKKVSKKRKHHESSLGEAPSSLTGSVSKSNSQSNGADEDDAWTSPSSVTDLTGPVVIVLPTTPPTCLASDANGRVFASPLENMIDDDARTAEPHDVRQVWVATKLPGTSAAAGADSVEIGFKGAHGGWLSCDSVGVLGATREARGTEEGFILEKVHILQDENSDETESSRKRGGWMLRTAASQKSEGDQGRKYLGARVESKGQATKTTHTRDDDASNSTKNSVSISLRGDNEADDQASALILRMQARFLPKSADGAPGGHHRNRDKDTKVSRSEMEKAVGRKLDDDEVKRLKRARRHGVYHEEILDMRSKSSHDKFA